jgi:carotenoid cleavage dioxygenase
MTTPFPNEHPFLSGAKAPTYVECDAPHLPVRGHMPSTLFGTLYRNGPNPQFAPRGPYHWFTGDGMVHAFRIAGGRVSYRNRWVRTPRFLLESERGAAIALDDPHPVGDSTVANTNVLSFAGKLLALEEIHAPYAMDPDTLMTLGQDTFGGALTTPMTAHPKIDPATGELLWFAYGASGECTPDIALGTVSPDGRLTTTTRFDAPYASMVHDFVATQRHFVLPILPLVGALERGGLLPYAWEPARGAFLAIVSRDGREKRFVAMDACYVFHVMNGFERDDGTIICDVVRYDEPPLFPRADGTRAATPPPAKLVRWRVDPAGRVHEDTILDVDCEFPRIDERFATRAYRHGYVRLNETRDAGAGFAHVDLESGRSAEWRPPAGDVASEPVFVPRADDAPEGDGWLLATVYRAAENRSDLAVLDARDVAAGPIALAELSHRVPSGFHGSFDAGARGRGRP